MALADSAHIASDYLNGESKGCSDQEACEATGIDVFKEYMLKLLPYNTAWMQSASSTSMNSTLNDLSTLKNVTMGIVEDFVLRKNGNPQNHSTMRNGTLEFMSTLQNSTEEDSSKLENRTVRDYFIPGSATLEPHTTNNSPQSQTTLTLNSNNSWVDSIDDTACPVEIVVSDTVGRYLRAKRNISAGEVLLVEPPVALATRPKSPPHCSNCYRLTTAFKCPDCGFFLCGPQCMTENHMTECQILRRLGTVDHSADGYAEDQLILERLAQIPVERRKEAQQLLEKAKSASKEQKHLEILQQYVIMATIRTLFVVQKSDFYKKLILLMQANLKPGSPRYRMNQKSIVDVIIKRLEASKESELVHKICSIWDTNAFQVVLPQNGRVQGLYPLTALINHDCSPNTQQWFTIRGEMVLRATDHITIGDTVSISYTDPQWSTIVRQNHLQKCKQFTCTCKRCLDPTELGTYIGSLMCPVCSSPMVTSDPLDIAAPWVCTTSGCDHAIQAKQGDENKILSLGTHLGLVTQRMNPRDVAAVVSLARVLRKQVHPNHFCLMQLYMSVLRTLINKDLSELSDDELSCLCGISAQVMKVVRVLQSPLARITASTAREDLRLRLESIRRDQMKSGSDAVRQQLMEMSLHLRECKQVLEWDPTMPSTASLLKDYQNLVDTS